LFFVGAAMFAWFTHQAVRAMAALARGEGVLARWHVDADAARAFAGAGHDVEAGPPQRYNDFTMPKHIPQDGLHVIIGKEAIQIGDSIQVLARRDTPEVTHAGVYTDSAGAPFAYLQLYYPGYSTRTGTHPPRYAMLRFPVPAASLPQAEAAMAYYRDGRPGDPDFFHGPGDGTNPEDLSECISCGFKTHALKSHCPKCGTALQSRRWARRFGFVLVLCGLCISSGMGVIIYDVTPTLLNPGHNVSGMTPAKGLMVLAVLALIMAFGLTALSYGIWQRLTGRRSKWVIAIIVAMWTMLIMAVQIL
jgi:predicted RNA-binding Zn-ribbon protein involved in translation (DUF1610 family)